MRTEVSNEFQETISRLDPAKKLLVVQKLIEFLRLKSRDMTKQFGTGDRLFIKGGPYSKAVKGLSHAHLTQDLSIVYHMAEGAIRLYGVYTHSQLGTGNTPEIRRQQSMADRFSNFTFSDFDPAILSAEIGPEDSSPGRAKDKKKTPNPIYQPKQRDTVQAKPSSAASILAGDEVQGLLNSIMALPYNRNFATKFERARQDLEKQELQGTHAKFLKDKILDFVREELAVIANFKSQSRTGRLYPEQNEYGRKLTELYRLIDSVLK
jgi:hypothetical protein